MRYVFLPLPLVFASLAWSQDDQVSPLTFGLGSAAADPLEYQVNQAPAKVKIPNPFARPTSTGFAMEMGMGYMEDEMMEMDDFEMDMMDDGPSPDQVFRLGLQRAIQSLKKAKTDEESEVLRGYVRTAFSDRYDRLIASRKKDLDKLKRSVAKLESDLKRREAAKDRVVQLQLQSVQLAAEGLLELGELQGVPQAGSPGM